MTLTDAEFKERLERLRKRYRDEVPSLLPSLPEDAPPPPRPFQDADEESDEP
mgnify:CR=1 FL=1